MYPDTFLLACAPWMLFLGVLAYRRSWVLLLGAASLSLMLTMGLIWVSGVVHQASAPDNPDIGTFVLMVTGYLFLFACLVSIAAGLLAPLVVASARARRGSNDRGG